MNCCSTGFRCSSTAATTRPASRCSWTARSTRSRPSGTCQSCRRRSRAVATASGPSDEFESTTGIAHTRWATHGGVTEDNAHPHFDTKDRVHIVLNGIVENHTQLRKQLLEAGAEFTSETDAEVVAHLIAHRYKGDLVEAVRTAYNELRGHYAFVAMTADEPNVLVGARKECPLIVGVGEGEQFLASAIPAFLRETRKVKLVNDGEIVVIRREGVEFLERRREAPRARDDRGGLGHRDRGEGRLRDLHAEGDLRAAGRCGRDDLRPHAGRQGGAAGYRPLGRAAQGDSPDRDRRVRHLLPRGARRPLRHRGVGAHAGRDGHRVRVPLPQPGGRRGRPRHRHLAVGRDRGHAGGDAAGAQGGRDRPGDHERDGQPGDARRGRGAVHARRAGDRRGRDEDVRLAGRDDVPARPEARERSWRAARTTRSRT